MQQLLYHHQFSIATTTIPNKEVVISHQCRPNFKSNAIKTTQTTPNSWPTPSQSSKPYKQNLTSEQARQDR